MQYRNIEILKKLCVNKTFRQDCIVISNRNCTRNRMPTPPLVKIGYRSCPYMSVVKIYIFTLIQFNRHGNRSDVLVYRVVCRPSRIAMICKRYVRVIGQFGWMVGWLDGGESFSFSSVSVTMC